MTAPESARPPADETGGRGGEETTQSPIDKSTGPALKANGRQHAVASEGFPPDALDVEAQFIAIVTADAIAVHVDEEAPPKVLPVPLPDFKRLLSEIGIGPKERIDICFGTKTSFEVTHCLATNAPGVASHKADGTANVWFSVGTLRDGIPKGRRGAVKDVVAVTCLWADLDVTPVDAKPGDKGLASLEECRAVIDEISAALGNRSPVAIVSTGHGLQPYWRLEGGEDVARAAVVIRRFGLFVRTVAARHGGGADNVFDLARILRVPGTVNVKFQDHPVPVTVEFYDDADPDVEPESITLDDLETALIEAGIPDPEELNGGARAAGGKGAPGRAAEPCPMETWPDSATCAYTQAMIDGWGTDIPRPGLQRRQWMASQAVRLFEARRRGCISKADFAAARQRLRDRFYALHAEGLGGPVQDVGSYEFEGYVAWAQTHVEEATEEYVREDFKHDHRGSQFKQSWIALVESAKWLANASQVVGGPVPEQDLMDALAELIVLRGYPALRAGHPRDKVASLLYVAALHAGLVDDKARRIIEAGFAEERAS